MAIKVNNMMQPELDLGLEATVSAVMDHRGKQQRKSLHEAVAQATKPDMVRVSPGRHGWVIASKEMRVPEFVLCRWVKQGDDTHAPVPVAGRLVKVSPDLLALLGFNTGRRSSRYETLYRLANAGFIEMVRISPGCWLIDLDSWYRHLGACMDTPEMWDDGAEDRDHYLHVNALGGWKRNVGKEG